MKEPLFILAPPRSFTSVVCAMIGQHPELYALPEVNLFAGDSLAHLKRFHKTRTGFNHGLLRAVAELGLEGQGEEEVLSAQRWLDENQEVSTADIFRDLADWAEPRRLVDKSPIYLFDDYALSRMYSAFPGANILHLTRHPLDTCTSQLGLRIYQEESGGSPLHTGLDPDKVWLQPHVKVKRFLDTLPARQWLRVRGELLLGNPQQYLPQIAEWLGVSTDSEAIAAMQRPELSAFSSPGPRSARFGNDPGFMESPALRHYQATGSSLDDPLPEGIEGGFSEALRYYATLFGYS